MAGSETILAIYERYTLYSKREDGVSVNKKFKCEIRDDDGEKRLSVTHNGYQWLSIELTHHEMALVKELLSQELEKEMKRLVRVTCGDNND